jgi:hypothetical protein
MPEKPVLVGLFPETVVLGPDDQVVWMSPTAPLRIEFDPKRCPFHSSVFQAPPNTRLLSGPPRPGARPGSYRYRVALGDVVVGRGEVIVRERR